MQTLRTNGLAKKIKAVRSQTMLLKAGSRDDPCLAKRLWNAEEFLREAEERIEELLGEEDG